MPPSLLSAPIAWGESNGVSELWWPHTISSGLPNGSSRASSPPTPRAAAVSASTSSATTPAAASSAAAVASAAGDGTSQPAVYVSVADCFTEKRYARESARK